MHGGSNNGTGGRASTERSRGLSRTSETIRDLSGNTYSVATQKQCLDEPEKLKTMPVRGRTLLSQKGKSCERSLRKLGASQRTCSVQRGKQQRSGRSPRVQIRGPKLLHLLGASWIAYATILIFLSWKCRLFTPPRRE